MKTIEELKQENKWLKELMVQTADKKGLPSKEIIYDGVHDDFLDKYSTAEPRILWILKEAYEDKGHFGWHVGDIGKDNPALKKKGKTLRQICLISYAVLKRYNYKKACEANDEELTCARQKVAQINISKIKRTAGTSSADNMTPDYEIWKDVLKKQIELYEPEIIICGNTLHHFPKNDGYLKRTEQNKTPLKSISHNSKRKYCYYRENGRLFINIYHPQYPWSGWEECINEIVDICINKK